MESNNLTTTTEKASESEALTTENALNSNHQTNDVDGLLTTVGNLPTINFLPYLTETDDISLLNLTSNSPQYKPIVREVFIKRYAKKYFKIEGESELHQSKYFAVLSLIGDSIAAIRANDIRNIDNDHWLVQLLNKHTPNLEKLCFKKCLFKDVDDFFSQHIKIKHLIFCGGACENKMYRIQLPGYRNLKSLELIRFSNITKSSLEQVLRHNPQMERLILNFCDFRFTLSHIVALINAHIKGLKELNTVDNYKFGLDITSGKHTTFVSIRTSFGTTPVDDVYDFVRCSFHRITCDYESVKRLDVDHCHTNLNQRIVEAVCSSDHIETVSIVFYDFHQEQLEALIENLPNLRFLSISCASNLTNAQILTLISKCKRLEICTIDVKRSSVTRNDVYMKLLHFHDEFVAAIPNPHTRLEFTENGRVIGVLTKDEIIWRNKLLHWVGYDLSQSRSNVRLLDLTTVPEGKHKQPLNLIFNYLDLNSLYSFGMASKECKQLVHGYVYQRCKPSSKKRPKQRSLEREKFYMTDEFGLNFDGLRMFGKNIRYLDIDILDYYGLQDLLKEIEKHCKFLTKLCFRTRYRFDPHSFILPQVRHFIFYGYGMSEEYLFHCDLNELSRICPNLEILEIRTVARLYTTCCKKEKISFKNLQKIKFKPLDDSQVEYAKRIFKNSGTEIVIDQ